MSVKFLNYTVHPTNNRIQMTYNESEYMEIIKRATALGLKPQEYLKMLTRPCASCGEDKIVLDKLQKNTKKEYRDASSHLLVFFNSTPNGYVAKTGLKLNYKLSAILQLPLEIDIFTPHAANRYKEDSDCYAALIVFKEGIKVCTHYVKITDNQIFNVEP